jgi:5-methyltetrahydrofolate--homocysteine methyltransferase
MAFDEVGQADTKARKIEICHRAYKILTEQVGYARRRKLFLTPIFLQLLLVLKSTVIMQ